MIDGKKNKYRAGVYWAKIVIEVASAKQWRQRRRWRPRPQVQEKEEAKEEMETSSHKQRRCCFYSFFLSLPLFHLK